LKNVSGCIAGGKLIRSAKLNKIHKKDIQILKNNYHVKKIIDLRTPAEILQKPDVEILGVKYLSIPFFYKAVFGISHEKKWYKRYDMKTIPDLEKSYEVLVSDSECILSIKKILQEIMNTSDGAVLWHCSEGKDRCGIISMFVLSILGVSQSEIFADYLKTNEACLKRAKFFYWLFKIIMPWSDVAIRIKKALTADELYLKAALRKIDEISGSIEKYITDVLGISEKERIDFAKRVANLNQ
jgi:protein-tyrosine phosphatase